MGQDEDRRARDVERAIADLEATEREPLVTALLRLLTLCTKVESELGQDGLRYFEPATERLIELTGSVLAGVAENAVNLLARARLDAVRVVPALIAEIEVRQKRRDYQTQFALISALGAFGEDASPAVPFLVSRLEDGQRSGALIALEGIGAPAETAIPSLEASIENLTFSTKSEGIQWRRSVKRTIRKIRSAVEEKNNLPPERGYIEDLIRRLEDDSSEPWQSFSGEKIAHRALAEARALNEISHLAELERILDSKPKVRKFRRAAMILARIAENTGSADAHSLLRSLYDRPKLRKSDREVLTLEAAVLGDEGIERVCEWVRVGLMKPTDWEVQRCYERHPHLDLYILILEGIQSTRPIERTVALMSLNTKHFAEGTPLLCALIDSEDIGYRKEDDHITRVESLKALHEIGDERALPTLLRELRKFKGQTRANCLPVFERLASPEAFEDVLEAMQKLRKEIRRKGHGPEDFLPYVAHGFGYFVKAGFKDRNEVLELLEAYREPDVWDKLRPEERHYLELQFDA